MVLQLQAHQCMYILFVLAVYNSAGGTCVVYWFELDSSLVWTRFFTIVDRNQWSCTENWAFVTVTQSCTFQLIFLNFQNSTSTDLERSSDSNQSSLVSVWEWHITQFQCLRGRQSGKTTLTNSLLYQLTAVSWLLAIFDECKNRKAFAMTSLPCLLCKRAALVAFSLGFYSWTFVTSSTHKAL